MGGERLWWTWGMAGRGMSPNITSLLVYSTYGIWNDTSDQEAFNATGNSSWPTNENSSTTPSTTDHDFVISIVIASILSLIILITVVGKSFIQDMTPNFGVFIYLFCYIE